MFDRLEKCRAELEKARAKRAEWDARVKELERRCKEEENLVIQGVVREAKLSPEELAELIRMSVGEKLAAMNSDRKEYQEDNDEENI